MNQVECSSEYRLYLWSDKWKKIRSKVLARDNYTCVVCHAVNSYDDNTDWNVHHVTGAYRFREQGHENTLITLCTECHSRYHQFMRARDWLTKHSEDIETPTHDMYRRIIDRDQDFIDRYFRICRKRGCFE